MEYPRDGIYSIGLVTGDSPVDIDAFDGEDIYNVYFPNSPNPTGGRLTLVPESDLTENDEPKSIPASADDAVLTNAEAQETQ